MTMKLNQYASVGALAGAALLLESALTRLLAVAQYYHFAFLTVSLALLGFGASGSILTVLERRSNPQARFQQFDYLLAVSGVGFAVCVAIGYIVVNLLPFDSFTIAWDARQIGYFFLYYLSLSLPFIFAGLGIGGALSARRGNSHRVYAANLIGSALGVILALVLLAAAGVPGAVLFTLGMGLMATLTSGAVRKTSLVWVILATIGVILAGVIGLSLANRTDNAPLGLTLSPYKGLVQALRTPGAERIFGRWNAFSRVDIVRSAGTHNLPGLSYTFLGRLPDQMGLSIDGDTLLPINSENSSEFEAADYLPEAIVFKLKPGGRTLVLEPGGGLGVLQGLEGGADKVTAVSGNPLIPKALSEVGVAGNIFHQPGVALQVEMPRVYLQRSQGFFDIIFLPLTDTFRPVTNGAFSLSETYLLTQEAFQSMLGRLASDGILVASRWLQTPPSEETRLLATLAEALERQGIADPGRVTLAWRGINTLTVVVKPAGWQPDELSRVRDFLAERRFDLVWAPDIQPDEVNRFNLLPEPVYYQAALNVLDSDKRASFIADFPYDITPPTDNHPFFYHFFTWQQTPDLLAAFGHTWQPFGGSGFFVLLALLALVSLLSLGLIITPLFVRPSKPAITVQEQMPARSFWRVLVYFACLGIGFLFVEIPLIQRWILLLGHPTYAFSMVVFVLLVFSSVGSLLARRWWTKRRWAMGSLCLLALVTPWLTGIFTDVALGWPTPWRILLGAFTLAPLAILMGLPFPFGLAWLEEGASGLKPWAWAINGCASVIAAVLAAILAITWGFQMVLIAGAIAYSLALFMLPGQRDEAHPAQVGGL